MGHYLSLSPCIEQCKAAVQYPPNGLPTLLYGANGTGKSFLSRLMFEYGKNEKVIKADRHYIAVDCAEYAQNTEGFARNLLGEGDGKGWLSRADGGMIDLPIAFAPSHVEMPLAQVISQAGKSQFHCAESEKFAHVTFFLNGGENAPFPGETDKCIPSPKGVPFDQKPELSLPEVADAVTKALGRYDFIVTNFANGDVVGHTLNSNAKLAACREVSSRLQQVVSAALREDYVVAITADHGNIEKLYTPAGKPDGAHTDNQVAFVLMDRSIITWGFCVRIRFFVWLGSKRSAGLTRRNTV